MGQSVIQSMTKRDLGICLNVAHDPQFSVFQARLLPTLLISHFLLHLIIENERAQSAADYVLHFGYVTDSVIQA